MMSKKEIDLCKQLLSEDERSHLEEILHGDLDGYYEEVKDIGLDEDFHKWKELSNNILEKCELNLWTEKEE